MLFPAAESGLPHHVAIIMDGNGRWAAQRGFPRIEGHRRGVESVRRAVRHAGRIGIRYLTLYSFSSENWRRPPHEIADLMGLLKRFIRNDLAELHAQNVRISVIGERDNLKPDIRALLQEAEELTRPNQGLHLVIAFNYGARQEILCALRALAHQIKTGELEPEALTEDRVSEALFTHGIPDPDLVIRTSGEQRISNFLLWQAAYAEFVFALALWPDFDETAFDAAIDEYRKRDRRFGGLSMKATG